MARDDPQILLPARGGRCIIVNTERGAPPQGRFYPLNGRRNIFRGHGDPMLTLDPSIVGGSARICQWLAAPWQPVGTNEQKRRTPGQPHRTATPASG